MWYQHTQVVCSKKILGKSPQDCSPRKRTSNRVNRNVFLLHAGPEYALLSFQVVDEVALPSRVERWYRLLWLHSAGKETQVRHEKFRDHEGCFMGGFLWFIDQRETQPPKPRRMYSRALAAFSLFFYTFKYPTDNTTLLFEE